MKTLSLLVKRNVKLFFKDKGMFFTSLITPLILLVLYATFLKNVYRDSFLSNIPDGVVIAEELIDGLVAGQLVSSLLAVCCITVAFCSNMLMIQDKVSGSRNDLTITPVKKTTLSLAYYIATFLSTMIICLLALLASLLYMKISGWYLDFFDILGLFFDVLLLVMFGTALSSIIGYFMSTQGQISAVGTIVSSCYGFICGAYMPISSFGDGLQKVIAFLPGTYGTSLLRHHAMNGVFEEMAEVGFPEQSITGFKDAVDCNIYFFDDLVSNQTKFLILGLTVLVLMIVYLMINVVKIKKLRIKEVQ